MAFGVWMWQAVDVGGRILPHCRHGVGELCGRRQEGEAKGEAAITPGQHWFGRNGVDNAGSGVESEEGS